MDHVCVQATAKKMLRKPGRAIWRCCTRVKRALCPGCWRFRNVQHRICFVVSVSDKQATSALAIIEPVALATDSAATPEPAAT